MPVSSPLITMPTAWPLRPGAARVAAKGTSTCAATENSPVSSVPTASMAKLVAKPLMNRPSAASSISVTIRRRRSSVSPSGTSSSSPAAYATCASVTMSAAVPSRTCSAVAIECSSGWLK